MHLDREDLLFGDEQVLAIDCGGRHLGIVLASDANERAFIGQRSQQLLVKPMQIVATGLIPAHGIRANFADKTIPQSIVQVCDHSLQRLARCETAGESSAEPVGMSDRIGKADQQVRFEIQTLGSRGVLIQPRGIDQAEVFLRSNPRRKNRLSHGPRSACVCPVCQVGW